MFKRIYHNGFLIEPINVENMQPLKMMFVSKRINCIPINYLKYLIMTFKNMFTNCNTLPFHEFKKRMRKQSMLKLENLGLRTVENYY